MIEFPQKITMYKNMILMIFLGSLKVGLVEPCILQYDKNIIYNLQCDPCNSPSRKIPGHKFFVKMRLCQKQG